MTSLKKLTRYIYENQKRGFSDIEIEQLLLQSGWQQEDINKAFKKTNLLKNINLVMSAPFLNLNRAIKSTTLWIISIPLKIIKFIKTVISESANKTKETFKAITKLLVYFLRYFFIALPDSLSLHFKKTKKLKNRNLNAAKELSKYIEKNLRGGALESDIFIELLRTGWNKKIIDKAFSAAHFRIFKENFKTFLKFLFLSPFILIKKFFALIFFAIKEVFYDIPAAIFNLLKKSTIYIFSNLYRTTANSLILIKNTGLKIFAKKPTPIRVAPKAPHIEKIALKQRIRLVLFSMKIFWRNIFFAVSEKIKKKPTSRLKLEATIIGQRPSPLAHLSGSLKYFLKSYQKTIPRLRQKFAYSLIQSLKGLRGKPIRIIFSIENFIRYDSIFLLKKIFIILPASAVRSIYIFFAKISILNLLKSVVKLFLKVILFIFSILKKILLTLQKPIKKIKLETFNIPFEIIEVIILKIYNGFKKTISPIILSFKLSAKSLRGVFMPASKEVGFAPQSLSEVPVGEVSDAMRALDVLRIASRMFKTRRMRTFLTVLGIGIGIGAILFLVSLGYGLQRILIEEIATSDALLSLDITTRDEKLIPLDKKSVEGLTNLPEVSYVSPLTALPGQISLGNVTANTMVDGTLPNYFKLGGITADAGELFKEGEEDKILISLPIVRLLNLGQNGAEVSQEQMDGMIGKSVSIALLIPIQTEAGVEEVKTMDFETEFIISGVIKDSAESLIYFPLSRLENVGITRYQSAKVRVVNTNSLELVRTKAVELGFTVAALSDTIDQANKVFQVLQIILALFGIVALAVSAIGMFNTMTIALLERTQEIGIMKSLGASNQNVWELFLAESIIMGFLGGVGGVVIGYTSSEGFNIIIRILAGALGGQKVQLFDRPWWFIVTILIFSTVVGLFTGLWPAKRAARINILQALRYK